ncbi:MAG: DUF192 domain-containing protein [Acidobacteria bacterium]|nr:DUF192 domain-containing protein [Acidobacteriota bacterium]MDA1236152.1 DUF192 domain-containing protein [Acidobacteriota bacterium]
MSRIFTLRLTAFAAVVLLWSGCAGGSTTIGEGPSGLDPSHPTTTITLPDGAQVTAELAITREAQTQGMMFRTNLRPGEGMLFPFEEMAPRAFWMFQTLVPLDIIWLDDNKRIVEISANSPPCRTVLDDCPTYGGSAHSTYVLELAAGQAAAHKLTVGSQLEF